MTKKFVWMTMLMLCVCLQHAFAFGSFIVVTKENQAELGLNFTLTAERRPAEAILIHMELPRRGKLTNLRSVSMNIEQGRSLVMAPLQTTPDKKGNWVVDFQLSAELADKCFLHLVVPSAPRTYVLYAIEVKGYMTDKK